MTTETLAARHLGAITAYTGDNLWEDLLYTTPIVGHLDPEAQERRDPGGAQVVCFRDGSALELWAGRWVATTPDTRETP